MTNQSNNQGPGAIFIGLGVLLIVLGALFFAGQAIGFDLGRFGWPLFVIIPGLAVSGVGLVVGGGTGERITPLGAGVTMVGMILFYQNVTDHFESWAYAWALVSPAAIGLIFSPSQFPSTIAAPKQPVLPSPLRSSLLVQLGEQAFHVERPGDHRELAILGAGPLFLGAIGGELYAVVVGVAQVQRLGDAVVGGAV
jgi:hypothetical protein